MDENEVILTIQWKIADIVEAMTERGIEPSEKNIKVYLNPGNRNLQRLEEYSIEAGWDAIHASLQD